MHGRSTIKAELKTATGDDFQSTQVCRAMKAVAELSAPTRDDVTVQTDEFDREHVVGAFEYHEKVNADADQRFKVLKPVEPEVVTLPA